MTKVTDTSKTTPEDLIVQAMAMGPTGAIEAQEARGQQEIINSTVLPYAMDRDDEPYRALGFTFGEPTDDLFREATLPEGWYREGTDHSMHSTICDADGYGRVGVFYKAAFYDRRADMSIIAVPKTRAQTAAYDGIAESIGLHSRDYREPFWMHGSDRREGPNYVYAYRGAKGKLAAERDGDRYAHGGVNSYADDGRRIEIEVAPNGAVADRREFTVEPDTDG